MSSSTEFKNFILEQLRKLDNIFCRKMMGEFILYYNGIIFGGIYDDRLLVKITNSNSHYNLKRIVPYKNAKPMFYVENVDDLTYLTNLIEETCKNLKKT